MKKVLCLCVMASMCLLTGCTKNYKTVAEYETAMKSVLEQNKSLTIEATQNVGLIEMYYKTQVKGKKWKTKVSMNKGASYATAMLYDGNELLSYSQGSPYAVTNPAIDMLKNSTPEVIESTINMQNPTNALINWQDGFGLYSIGTIDDKSEFIDNKANKNGFDCRLIKIGEDEEACVSDKYGIAVYHKIHTSKGDVEINLAKVNTTDIADAEFELPNGVTKMNLDQMLDNLTKQIDSMKKYY